MRQLERQLDKVRCDMQGMIYKGKRLYDQILKGGDTSTWKRSDFENVMEYYRTVNLPFVIHLEQDYRNLSASHKVLMLLSEELHRDDKEICNIMNMSSGALRTAKSRINNSRRRGT